jgi:ATP-binding cassette, subfamily B, bacterial PglK
VGPEAGVGTVNTSQRSDPSLWMLLAELYGHVSVRRRRHLYLLVALMVLGAAAELATLGSLLPFLSLLAGVQQPAAIPSPARLFLLLGATSPREQMWVAAMLFAAIAFCAGAVRLALNWSTQMFTALLGHELNVDVQRRILFQPYSFHLNRNSSQAVAAINTVQLLVVQVVLQLIYAFVAGFIAIVIVAGLFYIDPFTATVAAASFSLIYLAVSTVTRPRLARNSEAIATAFEERVRIVQESIGGIRDVIVDGAQDIFLDAFSKVSRRFGVSSATTAFMAAAPRFIIEAIGMAAIAVIALLIAAREGGLAHALPLLGALALGAQRLLPLLQQVYHGWASVSGYSCVALEAMELLRLPIPHDSLSSPSIEPLPFNDRISIEGVSFAYPGSQVMVLEDVSLDIPSGAVIGFVGKTGSGKSTLADLIMGLIEPTDGRIEVDGARLAGEERQRWQRSIAHVPQSVFLADTSIQRNIAFGVAPEQIDLARIKRAAATAQLHEFVQSLPDAYDTSVGERGIRLSGGQRQRLGIARAIYKQAPVLVLDEATSALDEATEAAVMDALVKLGEAGRTIIIIAHRLSTLARANRLVQLEGGRMEIVRSAASDALTALGGRPGDEPNRLPRLSR